MDISPVNFPSSIARLQGSNGVSANSHISGSQDASRVSTNDTVEISDSAKYLAEIKKLPDVRQDKVNAAKAAIASGTFETPARLNGTVNRLMSELSS